LSPQQRLRYLALPPRLSGRARDLARRWVGTETDPYRQAKAIETRLRDDYSYDLDSPSGAAEDPLDHFLFVSRRGHCEFYSTAMAILLRTLDVPTRNATGFIGGTYNSFGKFYAVRQGDAHSWVEVHLPGRGWTRFDPTPPSSAAPQSEMSGFFALVRDFVEATAQRWNHHVVGYNLRQQVDLFRSVRNNYRRLSAKSPFGGSLGSPRRALILLFGVALVGYAVYRLRKRVRSPKTASGPSTAQEVMTRQIIVLYKTLEAALQARGVARPSSTPPLAHARALVKLGHPLGTEVLELTEIYVRVRFGGATLSETQRESYLARVKALKQAKDEPSLAA
jgi:hypothetical protein